MGNYLSSSSSSSSTSRRHEGGFKSLPLSPPIHPFTQHSLRFHEAEQEQKQEDHENDDYLITMFADLPQEIVDRIRTCLLVSSYFRSFLVCKLWKNTAFSPDMVSLCQQLHPSEPWLLAIPNKNSNSSLYAFDRGVGQWRKMPMPFLASDSVHLPMASAGGLLCYAGKAQRLYVVNPFNKGTYKALPKWREDRIDPIIAMAMDNTTHRNYRIIVVGSYETGAVTEVYNSSTNQWVITAHLPHYQMMTFACSVFSNGLLYCLTAGPPGALLAYDVEGSTWKEVSVVTPSSYAYAMLAEHRGRVLLVGLSQGGEAFKSIRIWELVEAGKELQEVERMPFGMFKEFWGRGKGLVSFQFVSSGDLIYFYSKRTPRLVVCDLTRKPAHWEWLPAAPTEVDWDQILIMNFCVHPLLNYFLPVQEQ